MKKKKSFDVISNEGFNDAAKSHKVVEGGMVSESIVSNSATEAFVGQGKTLRCYNTNAATQFVHVGVTGLGIPTVTTGFAIQPSTAIFINSNTYDFVRTSSNDVQVIVLDSE